MIEPIFYFGISLVFAGLMAWAVVPLIRSRTTPLIAQERDVALEALERSKSDLDIKNQVVTQLKRERDMLKNEIAALRKKLGPAAQDVPSTQPWSTGVGPLFVELDPNERQQLVEHNSGAADKTDEPWSLRIVKNGSN